MTSWFKAGRIDSFRRALFFVLIIVMIPMLYGCSAININVGKGDEGSFSHPALQQCPGVTFEITVTQFNSTDQTTKKVTVEGTTVAGRATFKSRGLRDIDLTNIVTLELRVKHVPANPGTVECPYKEGEVYVTPPVILKKVGEDTYGLDADKFKKAP